VSYVRRMRTGVDVHETYVDVVFRPLLLNLPYKELRATTADVHLLFAPFTWLGNKDVFFLIVLS